MALPPSLPKVKSSNILDFSFYSPPHLLSCICPFPPSSLMPQLLAKLLSELLPSYYNPSFHFLLLPFQSLLLIAIFIKYRNYYLQSKNPHCTPRHTISLAWHPALLHNVVSTYIQGLCLLLDHKFFSSCNYSSLAECQPTRPVVGTQYTLEEMNESSGYWHSPLTWPCSLKSKCPSLIILGLRAPSEQLYKIHWSIPKISGVMNVLP